MKGEFYIMRRSNWKTKVLMLVAVLLGIIAGAAIGLLVNTIYPPASGLAVFGSFAVVSGLTIIIGVKIFGIGR